MINRSIDFVIEVCQAQVLKSGLKEFEGVSTDTRTIQPNELFIPLVGPLFNGHAFIHVAIDKGASVILVSESIDLPNNTNVTILLVQDTLIALQKLAKAYLDDVNPKKIAVTGSTGKSSTKEIIYAVLKERYKTFKNKGNYNNHIGLPLTILDMPEDTEILVIEMGMNHSGEIRTLCQIVNPDDAVITNIGDSHIEYFGSRKGILAAKLEIVEGFSEGNTLWVNGEDELLGTLSFDGFQVLAVGYKSQISFTDYQATSYTTSEFMLHVGDLVLPVAMPLVGIHNASNALFAVAVALKYGLSYEEILRGISQVSSLKMRLQIKEAHGLILVDDTYNASPDSLLSALSVLLELRAKRYILVFADILELGDLSESLHQQLGLNVDALMLDRVFAYGDQSIHFTGALTHTVNAHYDHLEQVVDALYQELKPGDAVLFKGSRSMHVDEVLNQVMERGIGHVFGRS